MTEGDRIVVSLRKGYAKHLKTVVGIDGGIVSWLGRRHFGLCGLVVNRVYISTEFFANLAKQQVRHNMTRRPICRINAKRGYDKNNKITIFIALLFFSLHIVNFMQYIFDFLCCDICSDVGLRPSLWKVSKLKAVCCFCCYENGLPLHFISHTIEACEYQFQIYNKKRCCCFAQFHAWIFFFTSEDSELPIILPKTSKIFQIWDRMVKPRGVMFSV